eukprot:10336146-Ditylum_brightwellii.AAC.1
MDSLKEEISRLQEERVPLWEENKQNLEIMIKKEGEALDLLCEVIALNEKLAENEKVVEPLEKHVADLTEENEQALTMLSEKENRAVDSLYKVTTLNEKLAEIEKAVKDLK